MALARLDVPGLMLYGGSIMPGHFRGAEVTIQDVFEAVGAYAAGQDHRAGAARAGGGRLARRRRLRRPVHGQHDGDGVRDCSGSRRPGHRWSRPRTGASTRPRVQRGELVMDVLRRGQLPSDVITRRRSRTRSRRSPRAAARPTGCCTCSRSPGKRASRWRSTTSTRSPRARRLCDLKPGGRFVATDLYEAGGVPLVLKRLREAGMLTRRPRR